MAETSLADIADVSHRSAGQMASADAASRFSKPPPGRLQPLPTEKDGSPRRVMKRNSRSLGAGLRETVRPGGRSRGRQNSFFCRPSSSGDRRAAEPMPVHRCLTSLRQSRTAPSSRDVPKGLTDARELTVPASQRRASRQRSSCSQRKRPSPRQQLRAADSGKRFERQPNSRARPAVGGLVCHGADSRRSRAPACARFRFTSATPGRRAEGCHSWAPA